MSNSYTPKTDLSDSLWTSTGKHPESMTYDELMNEIAVINQQESVHGHLAPQDLARLDCLGYYLEVLESQDS
jgi:hypothetical protein